MFWSYHSWDIELEMWKKTAESAEKYQIFVFSRVKILLMVAQNPTIYNILWKTQIISFRCTSIFCPNCEWSFAVICRKYAEWVIFSISMNITPGALMINRPKFLIFSSTFWVLSVGIFHYCIPSASNFSSMVLPPFAL